MSRDGNGNYTRVPGSGYPNGTTADGPEVDAEMDDIATALTQSLSKDGQTVPTANLPMGGYRHTNVDDAASRTDYARADQVQDCALSTLSSVSGADTITATAPLSMTAYVAGQEFSFVSAGANTGAVTLNINSIGAKDVTKRGTTALVAGDIASGEVVQVVYDGTRFQLVGRDSQPVAASETVAGIVELATDAEAQTGTDTTRAITPANLAAVTATETRAGVVELATTSEAVTGTDTARAVTPAGVASVLSNLVSYDLGADIATTSGNSQQKLGVPATALWIEIDIVGVSTTGTDPFGFQVGNSGGWTTSGYTGSHSQGATATAMSSAFTVVESTAAGSTWTGFARLSRVRAADTTWVFTSFVSRTESSSTVRIATGQVTISDLDRVRIAMISGASTFDAGFFRVKAGI